MNNLKVYIISDDIPNNHHEFKDRKWICDVLKQEFQEFNKIDLNLSPYDADVIWYLAPWNYRKIPKQIKDISVWREMLKKKYVISTIHHIDEEKYKLGEHDKIFEFTKEYTNLYHVLCKSTKNLLEKLNHNIEIKLIRLWVNDKVFKPINNKKFLKNKYNLSNNSFLVGSFQKDTEGRKYWRCPHCFECNRDEKVKNIKCINCGKNAPSWTNSKDKLKKMEYFPKLSKGPDLFMEIINDMRKNGKNIEVVLTGLRREYLMTRLKKNGIKYYYFNMLKLEQINELYNCLDLYVVSSRCEGGPRSIFEAGITKTPIISTDVGVSSYLLNKEAIFDANNVMSYRNAKYDVNEVFNNVSNLRMDNYLSEFTSKLYESIEIKNECNNHTLESVGINCINLDINCISKTFIKYDGKETEILNGKNTLCYKFKSKNFSIRSEDNDHLINSINYNSGLTSKNKWDNDKINILFSSDSNYLVGMFACLASVIINCNEKENLHFNFIIPSDSINDFTRNMKLFSKKINNNISKTLIIINKNIINKNILNSKCYNGGDHLLNLGNFGRLLIGEYCNYSKLVYLDSDSIVQYNIFNKLKRIEFKYPIYSRKMDESGLYLELGTLLKNLDKVKDKLFVDINLSNNVYMGAPFLANLKLWKNIYSKIINVIKLHNTIENGLYNLFTMSIQNIIFYNENGNINNICRCLPDCGSMRKNWDPNRLVENDILDWSGILKPWFSNGLFREFWLRYDILGLSKNYGAISSNKFTVEKFSYNITNQIKPKNSIRRKKSTTLLVGTTALNRLDLHSDNIKEWGEYLKKIRGLNVVWFLNVDVVDSLEFSWEDTVENFRKQLSEETKFIILPKKDPGFISACYNVSKKMNEYFINNNLSDFNTYVMWLEDDWKLNQIACENVSFNYFFNIMNKNSYVNLSFIRNNYIWALAPSLIGYNLFKNLHLKCWDEIYNNNISGDAEHLLGLYFKKNINRNPDDLNTLNIIDNKIKKIDEKYMKQDFLNFKNCRTMIYNIKYNPSFKIKNEVLLDDVSEFIKRGYNFIRISPGWCKDGVNYGRKYMAKKSIKKWNKGNSNCIYSKT